MCRNNDIRRDNWISYNDIRVDDRSNNNRNNSEFEIYNWGNFWFGDNFLDFLWMFMF